MSSFGASMETSPRPMNTVVDVAILQKLAHKDIVALLQKCQGDKVCLLFNDNEIIMNIIRNICF